MIDWRALTNAIDETISALTNAIDETISVLTNATVTN